MCNTDWPHTTGELFLWYEFNRGKQIYYSCWRLYFADRWDIPATFNQSSDLTPVSQ